MLYLPYSERQGGLLQKAAGGFTVRSSNCCRLLAQQTHRCNHLSFKTGIQLTTDVTKTPNLRGVSEQTMNMPEGWSCYGAHAGATSWGPERFPDLNVLNTVKYYV